MMERLLYFVDHYTIEIIVATVALILFIHLVRSFKRNRLIEHGQARMVVEQYDQYTGVFHNIIFVAILFLLIPLLIYVKFFSY
ncbi:MAG: hypothetical protein GXP08_13480 [Gammaproteobacteria bacterium]|nr:hypothetical protein [Gammaproteobacteria bacterium]